MRHAAIIGSLSLLAGCAGAQWELVWEDDFNGAEIDPQIWEHMIGDGTLYGLPAGWGNNELQYYTDRRENSYVFGGSLFIVAREEQFQGYNYTSARLRTKDRAEFKYGRIEGRIRLPSGQGIWPAFWMLPTDSPYGGWAASGEMDVVEAVNIPIDAHGTIHFGGEWPRQRSNGGTYRHNGSLAEDFHRFAMEWDPDEIRWYVDDQLYHRVTSNQWFSENDPQNPRAPFDAYFHMLLNIAVGGTWPGPPDETTEFPQVMLVDWVRVYARPQAPLGGKPHPIPGLIEAEDFDEGVLRQAYFDCDSGNAGGMYRPDSDVDIEASSEGGFNVGWICEGEWLEYTVRVAPAGVYRLDARVASTAGGSFRIEVDGQAVTGDIAVPSTGGWQAWQTVSVQLDLPAGEHIVRVVNTGDDAHRFNLDWLRFELVRPILVPNRKR